LGLSSLASTIDLTWIAPTVDTQGNPLTDLAGYKVYVGVSTGVYGPAINVGNVTAYTVAGLTAGVRYYFAITAYDTAGNESLFSAEINVLAT
jgi:hypothetical protein